MKLTKTKKFMNEAYILAKKALKKNEVPVGSIVVHNNQIIGKGYNMTTEDPSAHAEVVAIREASKHLNSNNLSECTIYTTLEPCLMCFGLINSVKIKKIFYDFESPENGVCGGWQDLSLLRPFGNKTICLQTSQFKNYPKLLNIFFSKRRNGRVVEGDGLENR